MAMARRKQTHGVMNNKEDMAMKFMTNIKTLTALLIVGAAFAACSGSDDITEPTPAQPTNGKYTMTVLATKGDASREQNGTRALTYDDVNNKITATWADGENVYVKKGSDWATGSLQPQTEGATATLKGELSGIEIAADDNLTLQFPKSGDITYTRQLGTIDDIQANFDWATADVTVSSVTNGQIYVSGTTGFINQQAIVKFTLLDSDGSPLIPNPSALTVTDGTSTIELTSIPNETYETNGDGVLFVAFPAAGSEKIISMKATVGIFTYVYETASPKTFNNGQYYAITVRMKRLPEGALSGRFTINESGHRVYFSKGNLQAYNSTANSTEGWHWSFAEDQWEYIGAAKANDKINGKGTISEEGTVDLFGWSTSETNYGIWNSQQNSDYSGEFVDWGNLAIDNGGYTENSGWRTLTSDEWEYLLNTRSSGSTVNDVNDARFTMATINSNSEPVNGLIVFPDNVTIEANKASWGDINSASDYNTTHTQCTVYQWNALEAKGCVFLPAAGYRRRGTQVISLGDDGRYTSSSNDIMYFRSGTLRTNEGCNKFSGRSVRLVRNVQ